MNCGYQYNNCIQNPFGCSSCFPMNNQGCNWFAIVLVVFLLLIICGNSRIRP